MLVLDLPQDLVLSALPAVERALARRPNAWTWLAARGELRRFLGEAAGPADLQQAGETYLRLSEGRGRSLLMAGNLVRLAGDARHLALAAELRAQQEREVAAYGHDAVRSGDLLDACFLLGDDLAVGSTLAALEQSDPPGISRGPGTRRERDTFSGTGGMNAYDWLEIALVVQRSVSGQRSERLREVFPVP